MVLGKSMFLCRSVSLNRHLKRCQRAFALTANLHGLALPENTSLDRVYKRLDPLSLEAVHPPVKASFATLFFRCFLITIIDKNTWETCQIPMSKYTPSVAQVTHLREGGLIDIKVKVLCNAAALRQQVSRFDRSHFPPSSLCRRLRHLLDARPGDAPAGRPAGKSQPRQQLREVLPGDSGVQLAGQPHHLLAAGRGDAQHVQGHPVLPVWEESVPEDAAAASGDPLTAVRGTSVRSK